LIKIKIFFAKKKRLDEKTRKKRKSSKLGEFVINERLGRLKRWRLNTSEF